MIRWTVLAVLLVPGSLCADSLRVAVYDSELRRDGPGILLRDIERGEAQVAAVVDVIASAHPDVLALLSFDWDHDGRALAALARRLEAAGVSYPYLFSARPNAGMATGIDLDGDGRITGPGDAQGYGDYTGQGGLAVLSAYPIVEDGVRDFSGLRWRDLPWARLPEAEGRPFPSELAQAVQRLSSTNHWAVPIALPGGAEMTLLTFKATPPVFDGPEDRNGRRNHDEVMFWRHYLDGAFGPVPGRVVLAGGANLDPFDSEGRRDAIAALLDDPRLADPAPESAGAMERDDEAQRGPPAQDTVEWSFGRLRVDYVLPSTDWQVLGSGVVWPGRGDPLRMSVETASRHRLVWVDLDLP
ncbi:MAG: endonuclease [Rhodobacteraceae bacterium]|nr:endonuclease [Paracoccaceae bacterium]MAY44533.1 endonuclease [Paracoccaceae bacterium]